MDDKAVAALAALTTNEGTLTPVGKAALRSRIAYLESWLAKEPQANIPLKHYFSRDVYAREITIAKGTIVVGAIHKHQNLNIISKGRVTFFSIDGAKTAEAPFTFVASPGVKRVIYAHEDTVWTTIHGTSEQDLKKIEEEFIAKNYEDVYLASERTLVDVLSVIGATPGELNAISENEDDLIDFDKEYSVAVLASDIHGKGLFATKKFTPGDEICPAKVLNKRTPAGRYINHSGEPNAEMALKGMDVFVVATKEIEIGDELLTDYFFTFKTIMGAGG